MAMGYIEIFKQEYICTITKKINWKLLVLVSNKKIYINSHLLQSYSVPMAKINRIFRHAMDTYFDIIVSGNYLDIIGNTGTLYSKRTKIDIPDLNRKEIIMIFC